MTNVILISTDQQRADSLGCYGNRLARTPHIDELAGRGATFISHVTPNQICSPSRATLFSGRYARHHGLTHNGIALGEHVRLLTHDFKDNGYATYGVGKFHFQPILAPAEFAMPDSNAFWQKPEAENWNGPFYGFDSVDILIGESAVAARFGHYANWLKRTAPEAAELYLAENALEPRPADLDEAWKCAVPEHLHYNSWVADRACNFIDEKGADGPFFMFVSFPDPHHPFSPPAPWCNMFDPAQMPTPAVANGELDLMPAYIARGEGESEDEDGSDTSYFEFLLNPGAPREQGFMQTTSHISTDTMKLVTALTYGSVAMIDNCIGRILAKLDDAGLGDNTLILFTSDHGELLGDHGLIRKGPTPYRQLLQVPLIITGPRVKPGIRSQLTSHVDIRATLQDYLGFPTDSGDGISLSSLLQDPEAEGRDVQFAEFHPRAVSEQYNHTLITPDWRLTIYPLHEGWGELFDRKADPNEHHNLFHDERHRHVRDELWRQLNRRWSPAPDAGGRSIAVY